MATKSMQRKPKKGKDERLKDSLIVSVKKCFIDGKKKTSFKRMSPHELSARRFSIVQNSEKEKQTDNIQDQYYVAHI